MASALGMMKKKGKEKLSMLTCYDALTAQIIAEAGVDMLLVGDSVGMAVLGYDSTLPVKLEDIIRHTQAVRRGAPKAFIVADMPFLTYGVDFSESVKNAGRLISEGGASAVKLEGGAELCPEIETMVRLGIPVMGHIGLQPQSVSVSGYRVAGRTEAEVLALIEQAKALEKSGVFSMVLEGTVEEAAKRVSEAVSVPVIGIGAGKYTDGQVLVCTDMLGLSDQEFRHNKRYGGLRGIIRDAVSTYSAQVKSGAFPGPENSFKQADFNK